MYRIVTCFTLVALLAVAGVASSSSLVDRNPAGFNSVTPQGGDLVLAMWDIQFSYDLEAVTGALGNAGAEFDGFGFYSTRWASTLIHEVNLAFMLVREFSIAGVSGLRDLAYDGTYFYGGAASGTIFEMDFATETLVSTIVGSFQSRAIAYDEDMDQFYCSNWGDPVWIVQRDGTISGTFNLVTTTSNYGFAYETFCSGVPTLWVFDQTAGGAVIYQWDLNTGSFTGITHDVAADFPASSGIAGGLWFYEGYVPGGGTIGGLLQGTPDIMVGYELCGLPPVVTPVEDLVCDVTADNDVELTWTNTMVYDNVLIYRDDGLIATLPGDATYYLDVGPAGGDHVYGVSGYVDPDESPKVYCSVTIVPVQPVENLVCTVTEDNDVELTWTNPQVFDFVNIYRDDDLIATLPGSPESYLDVAPGVGIHVYGVAGVIGADEGDLVMCEVTVYPGGAATCWDFNDNDGGWVAGGVADWQWSDVLTYVIDGAAWETNPAANYFNSSCGWIDSPPMNTGPEGAWLTFDFYHRVEASYDGWNVQMSLDGGLTWILLDPIGGYDDLTPYSTWCDEIKVGGGYTWNNSSGETGVANFDLTGYPNTSIKIRIMFASDSSVAYTGPVVDNICVLGAAVPLLDVSCMLLNPDMDGDGIRDVHVGEYMYYSATFINLTSDDIGYGAEHSFYAGQSCPDPVGPVDHFGPACKGTLPGDGVKTHWYRVMIPDNENIVNFNPFCVEVAVWECVNNVPVQPTGKCCFDVIILPGWEPPPAPGHVNGFHVEEIDAPPMLK